MQMTPGGITAANVANLKLIWTHQSTGGYDTASPIEANGIVYIADKIGNLVALNAETGVVLWHRELNQKVKMTPALLDGRLVVATYADQPQTADSTLYSLNPQTGSILWHRSVNGGMHGSPVAIAGSIYVPVSIGDPGWCHPGGVYVFNEATGAPGYAWQTVAGSANGGGAIWSSVTYDGSRLLFGTGNTCNVMPTTANAIVSLSTTTKLLWADQTAGALTDDDVGGTVTEQNGTAYVSGKNGKTYAVVPESGAVKWARNLGAPDGDGGFSTPTYSGTTLVVDGGFPADPYKSNGSIKNYGMLYGLDPASGAQRWKRTSSAPYWAPPATTPDLVLLTEDANIEDLDPATGAVVWSTPLFGYSRSQPAIARGKVFVSDLSGRVYAFALPTTANAELRRRSADVLRSLPAHNIVPTTWLLPEYCRLK